VNNIEEKFKIYGFKKFFSYALSSLFGKIWMELLRKSYSQKGEDLVIDKLLNHKKTGFYVDVGANDPDRFSNTKKFYQRGWTGVNIEPDLNNYQKLSKKRKKDINLNIGIGEEKSRLVFYKFIPDTLSTFSKKEADNYVKQGYKLVNSIRVNVKRLSDVLSRYCESREIDFVSIDTEGLDMEVLESNNWEKFKPRLICIESVTHTMSGKGNQKKDDLDPFLMRVGYKKVYDNGLNSIYKYNGK